jgi:5'(3')-deoxyribonucleotidase
MTLRILLDCDGVIADFITPALAAAERVAGVQLTYADVTDHHMQNLLPEQHRAAFLAELRAPGFCASIKPYENAPQNVSFLSLVLGAEIMIVTQPMSECPTWEAERLAWVERYLSIRSVMPGGPLGAPPPVISTGDKHLVQGDLFVDDNPKNVLAWQAAWPQGLGLLWDRPYNRYARACRRVDSWRVVGLAAEWLLVVKKAAS